MGDQHAAQTLKRRAHARLHRPQGFGQARGDFRLIDATTAYCEYIHRRYGRFPAYMPPFRTVLGFQAGHLDREFYERFYRADALAESERDHVKNWHD